VKLKNDYLNAVSLTPATYLSPATASQRIADIYQTARTGRLSTDRAAQLWTGFFDPLVKQFCTLPITQTCYDAFAVAQILNLATHLRQWERGDFGHAQKMFNLFLKDHWALNVVPAPVEVLLHLPIDRTMLTKLANTPPSWSSWTKVVVTPPTQKEVINGYNAIQASFRAYWQHVAPRFASPLEMEQFIWSRI
jgi:hypothetical protein